MPNAYIDPKMRVTVHAVQLLTPVGPQSLPKFLKAKKSPQSVYKNYQLWFLVTCQTPF